MADPAVRLTFDVDGMSAWIDTMKTRNTGALSRGEFDLVGTRRVLAFLERRRFPPPSSSPATPRSRSPTSSG